MKNNNNKVAQLVIDNAKGIRGHYFTEHSIETSGDLVIDLDGPLYVGGDVCAQSIISKNRICASGAIEAPEFILSQGSIEAEYIASTDIEVEGNVMVDEEIHALNDFIGRSVVASDLTAGNTEVWNLTIRDDINVNGLVAGAVKANCLNANDVDIGAGNLRAIDARDVFVNEDMTADLVRARDLEVCGTLETKKVVARFMDVGKLQGLDGDPVTVFTTDDEKLRERY